jgi:flagellar M-ring protein FliF
MENTPAINNPQALESQQVSAPENGMKNPLLSGFGNLNIIRQVVLMVGFAASVAIGMAVVLWSQSGNYKPLISNMDNHDIQEIVSNLSEHGIEFEIDPVNRVLLVPSASLHDARIALAGAGIGDKKSMGYEIMDQEQSLGTSQFMENTKYRRGLEGELARTISNIKNVRNARVHLAIPKESVFVRERRKPSASVFVELYSGKTLGTSQVKAIINLVSTSIPSLMKDDISVVDQQGSLLSLETDNTHDILANKQFEYSRTLESVLSQRISRILEPVIGLSNFQAEVSADVDFTLVEQTDEMYNPDLVALRSEQVLDEVHSGQTAGGVPGALSNQPPLAGNAPEEADGEKANNQPKGKSRTEKVRNYELDKTLSYTQHQVGRLRRLTVAVVVNDIKRIDPTTGAVSYMPWESNEIERLSILVRNAVGFDASRGDQVNVINSPFFDEIMEEIGAPNFWEQPWFWELTKQVLAGIFVLIIIFGLIKPAVRNLIDKGKNQTAEALAAGAASGNGIDNIGLEDEEDRVTLKGSDTLLLPSASAGYELQMDALKGLISEDPGRVAQVVINWVNDDK